MLSSGGFVLERIYLKGVLVLHVIKVEILLLLCVFRGDGTRNFTAVFCRVVTMQLE